MFAESAELNSSNSNIVNTSRYQSILNIITVYGSINISVTLNKGPDSEHSDTSSCTCSHEGTCQNISRVVPVVRCSTSTIPLLCHT